MNNTMEYLEWMTDCVMKDPVLVDQVCTNILLSVFSDLMTMKMWRVVK